MTKFMVQVDGGPEREIEVASGIYMYAVAALPALLDLTLPLWVKIWVPDLLPDYGPYFYRIEDFGQGSPVVCIVPEREFMAA